jgi:hypothetical protein
MGIRYSIVGNEYTLLFVGFLSSKIEKVQASKVEKPAKVKNKLGQ